jgi:6-phosphogluconolactonase (cycloisomerase 2 family)
MRSNEIPGDVRSFAWSPDGHHLHALDSKSSSLLDFYIADEPTLHELVATDLLTNTTAARQVITHPVGQRLYVVTQGTNELMDIALLANDRVDKNVTATRFNVLPKGYDTYRTTSVAISSSNSTLWTLSNSVAADNTFIVTAFRLDPKTGAVLKPVARSSFRDYLGDGVKATSVLIPAPFDGDLVAFTTYPGAMVAVLGIVSEKITAYGRTMLTQDEGCCGEGVWID